MTSKSVGGAVLVLAGIAMILGPYITTPFRLTLISASNVYIQQQGYPGTDGEWRGSYWIVTFTADARESYLYYKFDDTQSGLFGTDKIGTQKIVPQAAVEVTITPQQPYYQRALTSATTNIVLGATGSVGYTDSFVETSLIPWLWKDVSVGPIAADGSKGSIGFTNGQLHFYGGYYYLETGAVESVPTKSIRGSEITWDCGGEGTSNLFFYDPTDLNRTSHHNPYMPIGVSKLYLMSLGFYLESTTQKYVCSVGTWDEWDGYNWLFTLRLDNKPTAGRLYVDSNMISYWYVSTDTNNPHSWTQMGQLNNWYLNSENVKLRYYPEIPLESYMDNFVWRPYPNYYPQTSSSLSLPTRTFSSGYWELHTPFQIELKKTIGKNLFDITQTIDTVGGTNPVQFANPNDATEIFYLTELGKLTTGYEISMPDLYFVNNGAYARDVALPNIVTYDAASNSFSKYWYGANRINNIPVALGYTDKLSSPYPPGWSGSHEATYELPICQPVTPVESNLQSYLQSLGYAQYNLNVWNQGVAISSTSLRINLPFGAANSLVTTKISTELADSIIYAPPIITGRITEAHWQKTSTDQIVINQSTTENFVCTVFNNGTIEGTYILQATASAPELYINPAQSSITLAAGTSNSISFSATNNGVSADKAVTVTLQLKDQTGKIWDTKTLYATLKPGVNPPNYSDVTITVSGQGTTNPAVGHYTSTYVQGTDLTIQISAASGWHYVKVMRASTTITSLPPVIITNLQAQEVIGVFFEPNSVAQAIVIIGTTEGGAVTPMPGTYQYPTGTVFNMTATPYAGYEFAGWIVNNTQYSTKLQDSVTLSASQTYVIQAIFTSGPPIDYTKYLLGVGLGFVSAGLGLIYVDRQTPTYIYSRRKRRI